MVDLKIFDLWLEKRRYITNKICRKTIVNIYKKLLNLKLTCKDFEEYLEDLGFEEEVYQPISKYITIWNYRDTENKLLRKEI